MKKFICLIVIIFVALSACSQQPTWQEQYDLGVRYLSEGNYEEAVIAFTAAIEIEPKLADAYIGRGQAYVGLEHEEGNLELALADYMSVIDFDAENPEAYLGAADVYIRMGDYDKALEILQQGAGNIDDQRLTDKISELEQGIRVDSDGNYRKTEYDYSPTQDGTILLSINEVVLKPEGELLYWICEYVNPDFNYPGVVGRKYYIEYIYDNENSKLRKNYFYDDGILYQYEEAVLDDRGFEKNWVTTDVETNTKWNFTDIEIDCDDAGRRKSEIYLVDGDDSIMETKYYYDDYGYIVKTEHYYGGELVGYEEYK